MRYKRTIVQRLRMLGTLACSGHCRRLAIAARPFSPLAPFECTSFVRTLSFRTQQPDSSSLRYVCVSALNVSLCCHPAYVHKWSKRVSKQDPGGAQGSRGRCTVDSELLMGVRPRNDDARMVSPVWVGDGREARRCSRGPALIDPVGAFPSSAAFDPQPCYVPIRHESESTTSGGDSGSGDLPPLATTEALRRVRIGLWGAPALRVRPQCSPGPTSRRDGTMRERERALQSLL